MDWKWQSACRTFCKKRSQQALGSFFLFRDGKQNTPIKRSRAARSYKQKPHFPFTFSDLQLFNGGLQKSHDMFVACPHMRERLALLSYMKYHNEYGRIYLWRRMRRSRGPLRGQGVFFAAQFSAGYIPNMSGFDLRQAQPSPHICSQARSRTSATSPTSRSRTWMAEASLTAAGRRPEARGLLILALRPVHAETGIAVFYGGGRTPVAKCPVRTDLLLLIAHCRFGTKVLVTNVRNGRPSSFASTIAGHIDLSLAAARELDMIRVGATRVSVVPQ